MIAVYKSMLALAPCTCAPPAAGAEYFDVPEECPTCQRFSELNHKLLRLMPNLPPYETYAVGPRHGEGFLPKRENARRRVLEQALAKSMTAEPAEHEEEKS
jgi:hypothetical protein